MGAATNAPANVYLIILPCRCHAWCQYQLLPDKSAKQHDLCQVSLLTCCACTCVLCRGAHRMPGPHLKTNSRHALFMAKCQSHSWCHVQLGKSAKPNDLFQACLAPPSLASCCMRRVVHAWRSEGGWQAWDKARSAESKLPLRSGNVVRCRHAKDAARDGSGKKSNCQDASAANLAALNVHGCTCALP